MEVVNEGSTPLSPDQRYVFGYHPHGLFPIGAFVVVYKAADVAGVMHGTWFLGCMRLAVGGREVQGSGSKVCFYIS